MRKPVALFLIAFVMISLLIITGDAHTQSVSDQQQEPASHGVLATPDDPNIIAQGAPQTEGSVYLQNPVPPIPDSPDAKPFGGTNSRVQATDDECFEYISNPSFETNGAWFGQPSSNVGFSEESWVTGARSAFQNTQFYSNSAIWQTVQVPANATAAGLAFYSGVVFADPGDVVYISIYDETFSELIFWSFLTYTQTGTWKYFEDGLPVNLLAGRTIQLTFQMAEDYDGFYSEVVFDDVSLVFCTPDGAGPPTATPGATSTPAPTTAPPTATPSPTPTLLPATPRAPTPTPVPPQPGSNVDLSIARIQVGQALMADADPVTGAPVPLIAGKPALVRVYVDVTGVDSVENLDSTLFVRDSQNVVQTVESLNGPITLIGDSTEGSAGSTLNYLLDIAWLTGEIDLWAEVDPNNQIAENNESNNTTNEMTRRFQPAPRLRIAWVEMNPGLDREIALTSDSDIRRFFPVGANGVDYFFQPGFNQSLNFPLTVQTYPEYINALNRFWDRMTHEGSWVGGTPPDRLYGWAAGQPSGLCGVADAIFAGGRGRVATGYALSCGAETLAHELAHILDPTGLRHTANRSAQEDPRCVGEPGGPEPQHPVYPNLPLGSIGVVGFDASRLQILFPQDTYDFMTYCAPEWISPFNYRRMAAGFAPTAARIDAGGGGEFTAKLLVSGLIERESQNVSLDPFYVIRSDTPADASTGETYCIELHDESDTALDSRCFDLGFLNIETGEPTDTDGFSLAVPYPVDTVKVILTWGDTVLATRPVSRNQPFVRLTSPTGGADLSGDEVTVTWNGADLDDDPLFFSLDYSTDSGASWLPLAADLTSTSAVVDLSVLPGSNQVQFRVGATDGINTAYDTSDSLEIGFVADNSITVTGKPPTAVIRTKQTRIDVGAAIALEGTGSDLEDGLLPEEDLRWWSNRDGDLGTGSWLRVTPSAGVHTIILRVRDSDGNEATNSQTLLVGDSANIFLPIIERR